MPAPDGRPRTEAPERAAIDPTPTLGPIDPVAAETGAAEIGAAETGAAVVGRSESQRRLGAFGVLAITWLVFVILVSVLAPVLPLDDPDANTASIVSQGPGTDGHLLGGDSLGRDLLSRMVWGGRASLLLGTASVLLGLFVGGLLGLMAGYFRGRVDRVFTGAFDVVLSFPQLILAVTLVTVFANGAGTTSLRRMVVLILALGVVSIPVLGRITRANTMAWSQREFVLAARALGARNRQIMFSEVLPNVLPAMFSIALLGVAVVIVAEGGLSLLGVGVRTPMPSWGNVLAEGRSDLRNAPHAVMVPTIVIFLTVLALNYLGDVVRARFDVRESAL